MARSALGTAAVLFALAAPAAEAQLVLTDFGSTWKNQVVAPGAQAGFEQPAYDDSGFAVESMPFGTLGTFDGCRDVVRNTQGGRFDSTTEVITRRTVSLDSDIATDWGQVAVVVDVDDNAQLWWDGSPVGTAAFGCSTRIVIPSPLLAAGDHVIAARADDVGGNALLDIGVFGEDIVDPDTQLTVPEEQVYDNGATVLADYSCADGGSGIATCTGSVADGAPIDTTTPGPHEFTVTATDAAGNTTSESVEYIVRARPTVTVSDAEVTEGDSGDVVATLQVTATDVPPSGLTVNLSTSSQTATEGTDFADRENEILLTQAEPQGSVALTVHGDTDDEADETFAVDLAESPFFDRIRNQGIVTIRDDDAAVVTPTPSPSPTPEPAPPSTVTESAIESAMFGSHGERPSLGLDEGGGGPPVQRPKSTRAPVARLSAKPATPRAGQRVTLDAGASSDRDGKVRGVRWDLDDDGEFDDAAGERVVTEFAQPGRARVRALVDDDGGREAVGTLRLRVRPGEDLPSARPLVAAARKASGAALDFDRGLQGWRRAGDAFGARPAKDALKLDQVLNLEGGLGGSVGDVTVEAGANGTRAATSFRPARLKGVAPEPAGELATGLLVSPAVPIARTRPVLTFKLGGSGDGTTGPGADVRTEVWVKGPGKTPVKVAGATQVLEGENRGLEDVSVNLRNQASRGYTQAVLVAVDQSATGFLTIDNVVTQATPAAPADPFQVPDRPRLYGFADTHTHPTAHQGHGALLLGQRPYMGVPGGSLSLYQANPGAFQEDVGRDNNLHFGGLFTGLLINVTEGRSPNITPNPVDLTETALRAAGVHDGMGPAHQHMHITEIHRAFKGGLRLMSSLSVSNAALEAATSPIPGPEDAATPRTPETQSIQAHVLAMRELAALNADWMRLVYSPQQAWEAIADEKLAVVLGTEADGLGRLGFPSALAEVDWLWGLGIRQVGPVHAIDNPIGGTGVFQDVYNTFQDLDRRPAGANWSNNVVGAALSANGTRLDGASSPYGDFHRTENYGCREAIPFGECISWRYSKGQRVFSKLGVPGLPTSIPSPLTNTNVTAYAPPSDQPPGMRNTAGATAYGLDYIRALIRRGMLIDIDHMSDRTFDAITEPGRPGVQRGPVWDRRGTQTGCDAGAIQFQAESAGDEACWAAAYPLMSSHTLFRGQSIRSDTYVKGFLPREFERTPKQIEFVRHSGGIIAPMVNQDPVVDMVEADQTGLAPDWRLIPGRDDAIFFNLLKTAPNNCAGSVTGWMQAFLYGAAKMQAMPNGPVFTRSDEEGGVAISTDLALIGGPGSRFNRPDKVEPTACPSSYQANGVDKKDSPMGVQFGDGNRLNEEVVGRGHYDRGAQNPNTKVQYVLPTEPTTGSQIKGLVRPGSPMNSNSIVDYNTLGVQTYGLLPDFIQDAKNLGLGFSGLATLFNSADRYVRMWDKAHVISGCVGVERQRCAGNPTIQFANRGDVCRNTCPLDPGRGMNLRPDGSKYFP